MKSDKSNICILRQISQLIPSSLVNRLKGKYKIQTRGFSVWSHTLSHLFCQLSHSLSLNDLCDNLANHEGILRGMRGGSAPKRNTLSYANRNRDSGFAQDLFWDVLSHLQKLAPNFGTKYVKFPKGFTRNIYAIDSTTLPLVANNLDWAKHRNKKAAAKCHMQIKLNSFLPNFAIIKAANTHDSTEAKELCANLVAGEVALFDKAYVDYSHLFHLNKRGVFWVTRAKENMTYQVVEEISEAKGNILKDQKIKLSHQKSHDAYPEEFRLVEALVEIDGKIQVMQFITNNFKWAPSSVASLYQARWGIEVFFKLIKQNFQVTSFLGNNKNALQWQIWMALLAYVLLRFLEFTSKWKHSFSRLFTLVKGVLWSYIDLNSLLKSYWTANFKVRQPPKEYHAYLPGLEW